MEEITPSITGIIGDVEHMISWRGGNPTELVVDEEGENDDNRLAAYLRERLAEPHTPMWLVNKSLILISQIPRLPIQMTRQIWAHLQKQSATVATVEIISRFDIGRSLSGTNIRVTPMVIVLMRILDQTLVPNHKKISRLQCPWPASQLPRLQQSDAVCMYLGLSSGDVVQIHRQMNDAVRSHIYYRLVV